MSGPFGWLTDIFSSPPDPIVPTLSPHVGIAIADIEKALGFFKSGDWAGFEAAWKSHDTVAELEAGASLLETFLKIGSIFIPALIVPAEGLAVAEFLLPIFLGLGAASVPDGQGGYIPAHGQSIYDPKTGFFTGKKT